MCNRLHTRMEKVMEKISIRSGAVNIFRTANHTTKEQNTKHSNPFGLSFKGNVLQADVFSSSKPKVQNNESFIGKITEKTKAVKSTIVGGINNFNTELNTRFNNGINKIVSFGKKIGHNTKELWRKANETNIVWDLSGLSDSFKNFGKIGEKTESYKVKDLVKRPIGDLENMFKEELAALG